MHGDLIEIFKIINSFIVNYGQNMFRKNVSYQTPNLPVISLHSLRTAHHFFSNRVSKYWNQLPLGVRCAASIDTFKAGLDCFKSSKPGLNGFWELSDWNKSLIGLPTKVNM